MQFLYHVSRTCPSLQDFATGHVTGISSLALQGVNAFADFLHTLYASDSRYPISAR